MNDINAPSARLKISTRDMILAFILAFFVAVVVGALVESRYHDLHGISLPIAHLLVATLFILLVMLGGKQSLPTIIAATSLRQPPRPGRVLPWVLVAILAGLIFRFGVAGVGYGLGEVLHIVGLAFPEPDQFQVPKDPSLNIDTMLIITLLLGAAVEEISYRRILQSYFCRKYGLWAGILGVSVAFGAIHASIGAILAGFCLALLYVYSGRLWVAIIAHATSNLAIAVLGALQLSEDVLRASCILAAVFLIVGLAIATHALRRSPRIYD